MNIPNEKYNSDLESAIYELRSALGYMSAGYMTGGGSAEKEVKDRVRFALKSVQKELKKQYESK